MSEVKERRQQPQAGEYHREHCASHEERHAGPCKHAKTGQQLGREQRQEKSLRRAGQRGEKNYRKCRTHSPLLLF
ncbi:MAG: hypothetical protein EPN65_20235 [Pandoraea sp.]|nr:MAG: hypothetical protein EPN65_20235 [Pandoraea sp.]